MDYSTAHTAHTNQRNGNKSHYNKGGVRVLTWVRDEHLMNN